MEPTRGPREPQDMHKQVSWLQITEPNKQVLVKLQVQGVHPGLQD